MTTHSLVEFASFYTANSMYVCILMSGLGTGDDVYCMRTDVLYLFVYTSGIHICRL
jgi:hypothetical protein